MGEALKESPVMFIRRKKQWESSILAGEEISVRERCIRLLALSAAKNVKYHSSPQKAGQFFARNASERRDSSNNSSDDAKIKPFFYFLFFQYYFKG